MTTETENRADAAPRDEHADEEILDEGSVTGAACRTPGGPAGDSTAPQAPQRPLAMLAHQPAVDCGGATGGGAGDELPRAVASPLLTPHVLWGYRLRMAEAMQQELQLSHHEAMAACGLAGQPAMAGATVAPREDAQAGMEAGTDTASAAAPDATRAQADMEQHAQQPHGQQANEPATCADGLQSRPTPRVAFRAAETGEGGRTRASERTDDDAHERECNILTTEASTAACRAGWSDGAEAIELDFASATGDAAQPRAAATADTDHRARSTVTRDLPELDFSLEACDMVVAGASRLAAPDGSNRPATGTPPAKARRKRARDERSEGGAAGTLAREDEDLASKLTLIDTIKAEMPPTRVRQANDGSDGRPHRLARFCAVCMCAHATARNSVTAI